MKKALVRRLQNLVFSGTIFWTILFIMAAFDVLAAPLSEYAFWYSIGVFVGLPLFLAYDYRKLKKNEVV